MRRFAKLVTASNNNTFQTDFITMGENMMKSFFLEVGVFKCTFIQRNILKLYIVRVSYSGGKFDYFSCYFRMQYSLLWISYSWNRSSR